MNDLLHRAAAVLEHSRWLQDRLDRETAKLDLIVLFSDVSEKIWQLRHLPADRIVRAEGLAKAEALRAEIRKLLT